MKPYIAPTAAELEQFLSSLNLAEAVMCQTFLTHRRFALHKIRCQEVMK